MSDFGENLLRRVDGEELLDLARPHETDVLVRDHLVDRVVLGVHPQTVFIVLQPAPVDTIETNQRALFDHFSPVCVLVKEGTIGSELWLRPKLETEHSQHVLEGLLA